MFSCFFNLQSIQNLSQITASIISMLRISNKYLTGNLVLSREDVIIDRINSSNKVGKTKNEVKRFNGKYQIIAKSKILVRL